MTEFTVGGLSGSEAGEGVAVVGLHGLTATRRYVVMGSRMLERSGHRVVLYDARGHGRSEPGGPGSYGYDALASDLEAVLDDRGVDRAVLVGASMGAHTIVAFALRRPERVTAAVLATPAFDPGGDPQLERWDARAEGLRSAGVEGFEAATDFDSVPERYRDTVRRVIRQRMGEHEQLNAVADALAAVPRSRPFEAWEELAAVTVPVTVVASRDEADPDHPYAVAERYTAALPGARLVSEEPGASPLAWQGGQLSRLIAETASRGE